MNASRENRADRSESQELNSVSTMCFVLVFKTVFEIMIFRKIFDGDLTRIIKISRKIDQHCTIAENT